MSDIIRAGVNIDFTVAQATPEVIGRIQLNINAVVAFLTEQLQDEINSNSDINYEFCSAFKDLADEVVITTQGDLELLGEHNG